MADDDLYRAHALLSGMRDNVAGLPHIEMNQVQDYHAALDKLEGAGVGDMGDFRIPADWPQPVVLSENYVQGGKRTVSEPRVETAMFLTKIDAVLGYFSLVDRKPEIGFRGR